MTVAGEPDPVDQGELVARALHRAIQAFMCSDLPAAMATEATALAQRLASLMEAHDGQVLHASASARKASAGLWPIDESDISSCMNRSPISGKRNPVAPVMRMWRDGDAVRGEGIFVPSQAGPPGCVHGGVTAATFDELLAMAAMIHGVPGFTGHLHVNYHRPVPLGPVIAMRAWVDRHSGRKVTCKGEFTLDGERLATAEALFVQPRQGMRGPVA